MAANYLHGVETVELKKGPIPVQVVKSAVIGLVGIAPKGDRNTPILVQNATDAAQFGEQLTGFTIPQALDAIFKQGAGTVIVVNVLSDTNLTTVTDESIIIENGTGKTDFAPISNFVLKSEDGETTFVLGDDYDIDDFGNITVLDFVSIPEGSTVKASYKKLDPTSVQNSQIIGSYDSETDARTGLKCFDLCFNLFGFSPKILIAPGYSTSNAIKEELIAVAEKFRGRALIDAPPGTTPAVAIAGRGPAGEINFYTSSKRAVLLYPYLKSFDPATNEQEDRPYSQFFAGVWAATINQDGYWFSPSNREIRGVTGAERTITWAINDPQTDANLLNEKGIVTIASGYGTGIRTWGNRSAAWPTNTHPENFLSVQLTADVIHESIELAMLPFIDRPINNAIIDSVLETVNSFLRTLVSRGAIVDGKCTFDPAKNPPTEIALGHITFDVTFMPPTPAERITFDSFIDINLLNSLG